MIGLAFFILVFGGLVLAANHVGGRHRGELAWIIILALVARITMMAFGSDLPWFTNGVEGDWTGYERVSILVARTWERTGIYYYMQDVGTAKISDVSLPVNIFSFIFFLNGSVPSRLGGTAVVAGAACLTGLNFYALAVQRRVPENVALWATAALLFVPSIFLYSSHMYKDGLVLALTFGALAAAVRLSDKFSVEQLIVGVVCAGLLWLVRHYLLFAVAVPMGIGVVGLGSRSVFRQMTALVVGAAAFMLVASYSDVLTTLGDDAQRTFDIGTSTNVVDANSTGGSGIHFDANNSPWSQIHLKLAYTLLSPFPWGPGSLALQLAKLDGLFLIYSLYRTIRYLPKLWRTDKTSAALLLAFAVPMSVIYAAGVSNVGLIVRQRIPVTAAFALLAVLTFRIPDAPPEKVPVPNPRARRILRARAALP